MSLLNFSCKLFSNTRLPILSNFVKFSTLYQFTDDNNLRSLSLPHSYTRRNKCTANMRFVQYVQKNEETLRLGLVSEDAKSLIEISSHTCYPNNMLHFLKLNICINEMKENIENMKSIDITDDICILPPIINPEKIICIGLNYSGHCEEQKKTPPTEPMFFSKFASALVGPTGSVIAHDITSKLDWEAELAVIIGKEAFKVKKENAFDYVFGYCVAQDISARDWQKERNGGQFLIGKSMDSFCPLGPSIVHKSLISDPHGLEIKCSVNGVLKQCANTKELIFRIDDIIERLTECITLKPGDVILTGTPAGVGMHRSPPEYLKPGDIIETEIECLGKLYNKVISN